MSQVTYRNGRAKQVIGTISMYELDLGNFSKLISFLQKERTYYQREFVQKAGQVAGFFVDSSEAAKNKIGYNDYGSSYRIPEKRTLQFDTVTLDLVDVHDYDGERKELLVYGERDVTEGEAAAIKAEEDSRVAAIKERDKKEFERLKAQFEK